MIRSRRAVGAGLALLVLATGCSSDEPKVERRTTATSTSAPAPTGPTGIDGVLVGPEGDAFYVAPPGADLRPGRLVWASALANAPAGSKGWRILYGSTTARGEATAVSGVLLVPEAPPAGDEPLPVLALGHGTVGLADRCAPSRTIAAGGRSELSLLPADVIRNHVIVATDYEGLGTPGVHPYLVGLSEGRSILDSIRAAQRFPDAGATAASPSIVWGHSQGGGAVLVAAELAPTYAPDANVVGVAAGAPAAELKLLAGALRGSPFFGFLFMAAAGFKAAYPDLDLSTVLTPAGIEGVATAGEQCGGETIAAFSGKDPASFVSADPGRVEPFATLLEENSPGARSTSVPVFLYHGEADEVVPVIASKLVLDRYCRNGTTASRKTYPGERHTSVVAKALPDITAFLADRLAGQPPPSSC